MTATMTDTEKAEQMEREIIHPTASKMEEEDERDSKEQRSRRGKARRRSSCSALCSPNYNENTAKSSVRSMPVDNDKEPSVKLASFLDFHNSFSLKSSPPIATDDDLFSECAVSDESSRGTIVKEPSKGKSSKKRSKDKKSSSSSSSRRRQQRRSSWHSSSPSPYYEQVGGGAVPASSSSREVSSHIEEEAQNDTQAPPIAEGVSTEDESSAPEDPPRRRRKASRRSSCPGSSMAPDSPPAAEDGTEPPRPSNDDITRITSSRKKSAPPDESDVMLMEIMAAAEEKPIRRPQMSRRSSWHGSSGYSTASTASISTTNTAPSMPTAPAPAPVRATHVVPAPAREPLTQTNDPSSYNEHVTTLKEESEPRRRGDHVRDVHRTLLMVKHVQTGGSKARRRASWTGATVWSPEDDNKPEAPSSPSGHNLVTEVFSSLKSTVKCDDEDIQKDEPAVVTEELPTGPVQRRMQRRSSWHASSADESALNLSPKRVSSSDRLISQSTNRRPVNVSPVREKKSPQTFIMDLNDPDSAPPAGGRKMNRRSSWGHGMGSAQNTAESTTSTRSGDRSVRGLLSRGCSTRTGDSGTKSAWRLGRSHSPVREDHIMVTSANMPMSSDPIDNINLEHGVSCLQLTAFGEVATASSPIVQI